MPPADKAAKAKAAAAAKKIEDKTFGMKNKNKCLRDPVPRGQTTAAILRAAIDVWLLRTHGESQSCILKSIDCYGRNQCEHRSPIS